MKKLTLTLLLAAAGTAYAQAPTGQEYYPFMEIMAMKMMDKNKDGMVSKTEFMDMMNMAWEMNAKKMGVKADKMSKEQFEQMLHYLQAGRN
jgi:Ca2+-binding EF-hand superfamily protein